MTTTPTLVDAQRGLRQLYDRAEITDLVYRLGTCMDEGRYDEMRELLVEDATVSTPGGQAEGRAALIAQARRNHPADQRFQHVTTNVLLDLDGDRATVRANLVVTITTPDDAPGDAPAPPPRCTIGEVYSFELVRTSGGWRFSRIATVPLWVSGTLPARVPAA
jgi:hypothetical protein